MTFAHVSPWRPRVSCRRVDVEAWLAVRRACEAQLSLSDAARLLRDIVQAKVDVRFRGARRGPVPAPFRGGLAMELGVVGEELTLVSLEVEAQLAVNLTARALKRPAPKLSGFVGGDEAATLAGGLAAIVAAVSRARAPAGPLHVRNAGSSEVLLDAWRARGGTVDTATLGVSVDGEAYVARVLVAAGLPSGPPKVLNRAGLAGLGSAPLDVPIVATTSLATVADVAALGVGDAWMLGAVPLFAKGRRADNTFLGEVVLAAPGASSGARAALVEGGVLVLRAGREELRLDPMPEEGADDPIVEAVGDVPIVVRVEVGVARMTAREWAELRVGDVVNLAHKLAEPVTLRVGGVEVAKGELVDVEGEIGVRVLSRGGAGRAP